MSTGKTASRRTTTNAARSAGKPTASTAIYTRISEPTAIYTRISEDRMAGAGVKDQFADCYELAERNGWGGRLSHFEDNDISASAYARKRRPSYRDMLAKIRDGEIRRVVVAHIDRLYRQPKELEELIDLADAGKIEIVSVYSGPVDLSTSDGRAIARIQVAIASKSSEDTSRRVERAMRRIREAGEWTGGPRPFGWLRVTVTDQDGTERETWDPMAHDPDEADLIRDAIQAVIAGASLTDIARRWNNAGVRQAQQSATADAPGPRWTGSIVQRVLTSPRNAGLVPHYRQEKGEDGIERKVMGFEGTAKWPAIIDRADWERCREVLEDRRPRWVQPRRRSLLTGLVICGNCGATMTRDSNQGRKVWRCPADPGKIGADGKPACGRVSIGADHLEAYLTSITFERSDAANVNELVDAQTTDREQWQQLTAALADVDRRLTEAADSQAAGRMSMRAYERLTTRLEAQQRDLQAQFAKAGSNDTAVLARYAGRPGALRAQWENDEITQDEKRAAIRRAVGPVAILPITVAGVRHVGADRVVPTVSGFVSIRSRPSPSAA
jgi:site-specific DNA recombinase